MSQITPANVKNLSQRCQIILCQWEIDATDHALEVAAISEVADYDATFNCRKSERD